jgi:hypothetical protein
MAYRETYCYVVLCDRCSATAPEGTGWRTPAIADRAAIEAGWEMTRTEHLCPACSVLEASEPDGGVDPVTAGPALPPAPTSVTRPDVCWPPGSPAHRAWEGTR